jgi:hypothetical protein
MDDNRKIRMGCVSSRAKVYVVKDVPKDVRIRIDNVSNPMYEPNLGDTGKKLKSCLVKREIEKEDSDKSEEDEYQKEIDKKILELLETQICEPRVRNHLKDADVYFYLKTPHWGFQ